MAEHVDWRLAIDLYYQDKMVESYDVASRLGTGQWGRYLLWYRMIEAEYITRARSQISGRNEWLRIEMIAEEVPEDPSLPIEAACLELGTRFGWGHGHPTMVSIMAMESDAPWTSGRHGFCIDKQPYAKICLPHYLLGSPDQLRSAVLHEYAHVMSGSLSHGRVPVWLNEAVAMIAGDEWNPNILRALRDGRLEWVSALELDVAHGGDRRGPGDAVGDVRVAYHQSGVIGRYLASLSGEEGLAKLMRAFANNSLWTEAKIAAGLLSPVDEALREVYGVGVEDVFERAREWFVAGGW